MTGYLLLVLEKQLHESDKFMEFGDTLKQADNCWSHRAAIQFIGQYGDKDDLARVKDFVEVEARDRADGGTKRDPPDREATRTACSISVDSLPNGR